MIYSLYREFEDSTCVTSICRPSRFTLDSSASSKRKRPRSPAPSQRVFPCNTSSETSGQGSTEITLILSPRLWMAAVCCASSFCHLPCLARRDHLIRSQLGGVTPTGIPTIVLRKRHNDLSRLGCRLTCNRCDLLVSLVLPIRLHHF